MYPRRRALLREMTLECHLPFCGPPPTFLMVPSEAQSLILVESNYLPAFAVAWALL